MMKKLSMAALTAIGAVGFFTFAYAANPFTISFPIPELGNCGSMNECKTYCDVPENLEACTTFAEGRGLASKKQVEQAKALSAGGPGSCRGEEACRNYCSDASHSEECLVFAEKHGFISKDDAKQSRKFLGATGPGGCKGEECKTYCADPAHQEACVAFAEKNGLISREDAQQTRVQRRQFQEEGGPGGCKSPQECRIYCDSGEHLDECVDFGVKHGFMKPEEAERIKKLSGKGPGGCRGREQCEAYCKTPEHGEECLRFAEANGLIPKEEADQARKFINQTGPGGCKGEECRTYCDDAAHAEECVNFGVEHGFIPKEEATRAKQFARVSRQGGPGGCKGEECRTYCSDAAHHDECFNFAKAQGLIRPEEQKQFEQSRRINDQIKTQGGPGGCKSEQECLQYCTSDSSRIGDCANFGAQFGGMSADEARQRLQEFKDNGGRFGPPPGSERGRAPGFGGPRGESFGPQFGPPPGFGPQGFGGFGGDQGGQQQQQFAGPGGCNSPQSCAEYCIDHRDECVAVFRKGQQPPPQAQDAPKTGPGGCQGFAECSAYCQDPSHQEECGRFGKPGEGERNVPRPIGPPTEFDQDGRPIQKQFPFPGQGRGGEFAPPFGGNPQGGNFDAGSFSKPPCNTPDECAALAKKFIEKNGIIDPSFKPRDGQGFIDLKNGARPDGIIDPSFRPRDGQASGDRPGVKPGEQFGGNAPSKPPCSTPEECAALAKKFQGQNGVFPAPPGDRPGIKPGENGIIDPSFKPRDGQDFQKGFDPSKMTPEQQKAAEQFGNQGGFGGGQQGQFGLPPGSQPGIQPGGQFGGQGQFGPPPGSQPGVQPGGGNFGPPPSGSFAPPSGGFSPPPSGGSPPPPPPQASVWETLRSLFAR